MTRREFLSAAAAVTIPLRQTGSKLRFAVITDVHHGLAPDSLDRMRAFVAEVKRRRGLDFVLQLGDFCHSNSEAETRPFLDLWNSIDLPKHHVLGNHDMDRGTKSDAMRLWGMPARFYAFEAGDYRFITLDLNHFKKAGKLHGYAHGNYFTDNATHNWADPEQLQWLERELSKSRKPTIILSHQPLGLRELDGRLAPEQDQVMAILEKSPPVVACLFGHLHVDRLERERDIPCLCVNSASYFWQSGMHPYRDPLFAFVSLGDGQMRIEGRHSEFRKGQPKTSAAGCSASIANRRLWLT
ncbi:MAG TPA: metallophosphoesterase [Fimbriimonas sp.]|nr:metallophosphoesterase [Fimbriimonas sp.]